MKNEDITKINAGIADLDEKITNLHRDIDLAKKAIEDKLDTINKAISMLNSINNTNEALNLSRLMNAPPM